MDDRFLKPRSRRGRQHKHRQPSPGRVRDEVSDDLSDLSPLEDENSTPVPLEVPVATHGRKRQERRKPKQQPPPDEAAESDEESSHVEEGRIERERSPERQKAEAAEQSEVKKQSQMIKQPRVKEERAGHPETPARSTELRPKDSSLTKPPEDDYVALYTGGSPPAVEQTRHPPRAKSEESASGTQENTTADMREETSFSLAYESGPDDEDRLDDVNSKRTYREHDKIQYDEDQEHEFKAVQIAKRPDDQIAEYCEKYINSFLNTEGGVIYFGVQDDGTILGIVLNRAMRDQIRLRIDGILASSRPRIDPSLVTVDFVPVEESADRKKKRLPATRGKDKKNFKRFNKDDGTMPAKYVVEVIVRKGRAPLYFTRAGVAYARFSGSTHKMSQEVLEERQKMGRVYHDRNISTFPKDFIGRQKEIETIRQFVLHNLSSTAPVSVVILYGLPIVGKSALARRLVAEMSPLFPDLSVLVDMKGFASSYMDIADAMVSVIRTVNPNMDVPDKKTQIAGVYESCFSGKRCIMLLENVGTAEQIKSLIPLNARAVLVIATSRKDLSTVALEYESLNIRLGALRPEDAMQLLRAVARVPMTDAQASAIAARCGFMPLFVRIVGNTMRTKNVTPEKMIELLHEKEKWLELVNTPFQTVFEACTPKMKQQLEAISLFPASFDTEALSAVLELEPVDCAKDLAELASQTLIEEDVQTGRWVQNDLLRMFLHRQAKQNPLYVTWMERFVRHFLRGLERIVGLNAPGQKEVCSAVTKFFTYEKANLEATKKYTLALGKFELIIQLSRLIHVLSESLHGRERKLCEKFLSFEPPPAEEIALRSIAGVGPSHPGGVSTAKTSFSSTL